MRIKELGKWIRANCFENGKWTNRRVLIFTEWEDTLRYLQTQIKGIVADADPDEERVKIYRGFTKEQDRESLRDAFNAPPEEDPLRILIATDAAREGLNLQALPPSIPFRLSLEAESHGAAQWPHRL